MRRMKRAAGLVALAVMLIGVTAGGADAATVAIEPMDNPVPFGSVEPFDNPIWW